MIKLYFKIVNMLKLGGHMTTTTFVSKETKVLTALEGGAELTSKQIAARFGAGNPQAVIQSLRFKGYPIYLNTHSDSKGRVTKKYRLGTASREVIAAGYQALANS
jgi:predicted transcriptional regulator